MSITFPPFCDCPFASVAVFDLDDWCREGEDPAIIPDLSVSLRLNSTPTISISSYTMNLCNLMKNDSIDLHEQCRRCLFVQLSAFCKFGTSPTPPGIPIPAKQDHRNQRGCQTPKSMGTRSGASMVWGHMTQLWVWHQSHRNPRYTSCKGQGSRGPDIRHLPRRIHDRLPHLRWNID